jgi:tetratricopeptide (TPR) repeat protein
MKLEAGHLNEMRGLADRAIAVLVEANRSVPEVQNLLGRAEGLVGFSYAATPGGRDIARDYYDKALGQLESLEQRFDKTTSVENDWRWLRSLAMVRTDMGDLLLTQFGQIESAEQYIQRSIDIWTKLKRLRPDDPDVAYRLSWAENKLGDVLRAEGEDDLALGSFEKAERGLKPVAERLSVDQWRLRFLAIAQNNIGLARRALGLHEEAISAFQQAAQNIDTLVSYDPNQSSSLSIKAWTYNNIGETKVRWARTKGDASPLQGARDALKTALDLRNQLARGTDNPRWKIAPAVSRASIAAHEGTEKELARDCRGAAEDFDKAVRENPSGTGDERDDELALRSAEFREWAGLAYRNAGNNMAAENDLREALKIVNDQPPKFPGSRKAFANMRQRLERELQGSPTGACTP